MAVFFTHRSTMPPFFRRIPKSSAVLVVSAPAPRNAVTFKACTWRCVTSPSVCFWTDRSADASRKSPMPSDTVPATSSTGSPVGNVRVTGPAGVLSVSVMGTPSRLMRICASPRRSKPSGPSKPSRDTDPSAIRANFLDAVFTITPSDAFVSFTPMSPAPTNASTPAAAIRTWSVPLEIENDPVNDAKPAASTVTVPLKTAVPSLAAKTTSTGSPPGTGMRSFTAPPVVLIRADRFPSRSRPGIFFSAAWPLASNT